MSKVVSITLYMCAVFAAANLNADCSTDAERKPTCSYAECKLRANLVHPTCDVSKVCSKKSSAAQLLLSIEKHKKCLAARERVADCFIAPDTGHNSQLQDSRNGIAKCNLMLEKLSSKAK